MNRIVQYFRECIVEMKKVVWPSRDEVKASTKVVILTLVGFAVVLGLFDLGISELVKTVFK